MLLTDKHTSLLLEGDARVAKLLQNWCIKVGLCGWSSGISGHFNYF
jgi:hypothetical protein